MLATRARKRGDAARGFQAKAAECHPACASCGRCWTPLGVSVCASSVPASGGASLFVLFWSWGYDIRELLFSSLSREKPFSGRSIGIVRPCCRLQAPSLCCWANRKQLVPQSCAHRCSPSCALSGNLHLLGPCRVATAQVCADTPPWKVANQGGVVLGVGAATVVPAGAMGFYNGERCCSVR